MTKKEKASLVRVLIDLIKADNVIDEGEMALYAKLKNDYSISREDELSASSMTLADAISILSNSTAELRSSLMDVFSDMTVSDGFCAKQEAQLMIALVYCLGNEFVGMSEVYSIYEPNVYIEDNQVVYVESAFDKSINEEITNNYRSIDKEFRLAGFNFVYIPYISSHYKNTDLKVFKEVAKFLAPNISEENIPKLVDHLCNVTTAEYCSEQLCNKLGMKSLRDVPPSFLIKISNTYVGEKLYTNFLRITIDDDILPMSQKLIDTFCGMLSSDTRFISNNEEAHGQFMYHGFYKQLFDIYVIQRGVKSKILIDFLKGKIILPELGMEIKGLHRRDKALYTLFLIESFSGGINFSLPNTAKQKKAYSERMTQIQNKYRLLYKSFNGDVNTTPHLDESDIRRPIISNIRRCVTQLGDSLHNIDDYNVTRNSYGNYCTNISPDIIFVIEHNSNNEIKNILNSQIYNKLKAL